MGTSHQFSCMHGYLPASPPSMLYRESERYFVFIIIKITSSGTNNNINRDRYGLLYLLYKSIHKSYETNHSITRSGSTINKVITKLIDQNAPNQFYFHSSSSSLLCVFSRFNTIDAHFKKHFFVIHSFLYMHRTINNICKFVTTMDSFFIHRGNFQKATFSNIHSNSDVTF